MSRLPSTGTSPALGTVVGFLLTAAVTIALLPLRDDLTAATPALLLVLVVVIAAVIGGAWASISTAVVAAIALNLGYIQPYGTFKINQLEDAVEFVNPEWDIDLLRLTTNCF